MAAEKAKQEQTKLEDVTKQVEEILAKAREEASKIVAGAKASAQGEPTEEERLAQEKRKEYWNELVEIRLMKDSNKYRDDVFVSVNGENCVIKRGERVKIKRKFAAVLDNSDMQEAIVSSLIEEKTSGPAKIN